MMQQIGTIQSQWGEGPIWHEDRLYYVDIEGHKVIAYHPESGEETVWDVGERVGTVVPRAAGGLVIAGDNGFAFLDPASGTVTPIDDPEPDKKPANRFNDGKCDPSGRFWAGTISTVKKTGDAALYCMEADLSVSLKFPNVTNSNGLCWSLDHKTMYYIDTPSKSVRAFNYDAATGMISDERIAIRTDDIEGSPDGMTIDENGDLWIAFCRGSRVDCIDPHTQERKTSISFPMSGITACAFGGPDLATLYVTTGVFGGIDEPGAGYVYAVDAGVRGVPAFRFAG